MGPTVPARLRVVGTGTVTRGTVSVRPGGASGVSTGRGTTPFTRRPTRSCRVSGRRTVSREVRPSHFFLFSYTRPRVPSSPSSPPEWGSDCRGSRTRRRLRPTMWVITRISCVSKGRFVPSPDPRPLYQSPREKRVTFVILPSFFLGRWVWRFVVHRSVRLLDSHRRRPTLPRLHGAPGPECESNLGTALSGY